MSRAFDLNVYVSVRSWDAYSRTTHQSTFDSVVDSVIKMYFNCVFQTKIKAKYKDGWGLAHEYSCNNVVMTTDTTHGLDYHQWF